MYHIVVLQSILQIMTPPRLVQSRNFFGYEHTTFYTLTTFYIFVVIFFISSFNHNNEEKRKKMKIHSYRNERFWVFHIHITLYQIHISSYWSFIIPGGCI